MNLESLEGKEDALGFFGEEMDLKRKISLKDFMLKVELNLIIASLKKAKGNQKKAAEILGIKPTTLHEKMKRHNIKLKEVSFYSLKTD
jgi:transcriptional regulator with GAF, ATPase, and Fis domain